MPVLLHDPRVGVIAGLGDQQQIVAAETRGLFPKIAVLVESHRSDRMAIAHAGMVLPDADFDQPVSGAIRLMRLIAFSLYGLKSGKVADGRFGI